MNGRTRNTRILILLLVACLSPEVRGHIWRIDADVEKCDDLYMADVQSL